MQSLLFLNKTPVYIRIYYIRLLDSFLIHSIGVLEVISPCIAHPTEYIISYETIH